MTPARNGTLLVGVACLALLLGVALAIDARTTLGLAALTGSITALVCFPIVTAIVFLGLATGTSRDQLYAIQLPPPDGPFRILDVLALLLLVTWAVGASRSSRVIVPSNIAVTLALFLLAGVASACVGLTAKWGTGWTVADLRPMLYYATFLPLVGFSVRKYSSSVLATSVVLAAATAGFTSTIRYLGGQGTPALYTDSLRVDDVAYGSLAVAIFLIVPLYESSSRLWQRLALLAISLPVFLGILLTFRRMLWVALVLGAIYLVFRSRMSTRRLLASGICIALSLAALALATSRSSVSTDPSRALLARAQSLEQYTTDVSVRHRKAETTAAVHAIASSPIYGLGAGGRIEFVSPRLNPNTHQTGGLWVTHYVHNAGLWLALKAGPITVVLFLAFIWSVIRTSGPLCRAERPRSITYEDAALAGLVSVFVLSFTEATLFYDNTVPVIALCLAVILAKPSQGQTTEP